MKSRNIEWRNDYLILAAIALVVLLLVLPRWIPAQAAPPAPPDVKPCVAINTATLANGGVIEVFRCEPENAPPYKINSLGFMLNED